MIRITKAPQPPPELSFYIDGLNEVTAATRARIAQFVENNFHGNILIATQPTGWDRPATARLYELKPLSEKQLADFPPPRTAPRGPTLPWRLLPSGSAASAQRTPGSCAPSWWSTPPRRATTSPAAGSSTCAARRARPSRQRRSQRRLRVLLPPCCGFDFRRLRFLLRLYGWLATSSIGDLSHQLLNDLNRTPHIATWLA